MEEKVLEDEGKILGQINQKNTVISKHKVHYLALKREGDGKWTQKVKVHIAILNKKSKNLNFL